MSKPANDVDATLEEIRQEVIDAGYTDPNVKLDLFSWLR